MFGISALLGLPIAYIFSTLFKNENGFLNGVKEVIAFLYITFRRRGKKSRLDFYDYENYNEDLVKLAIVIPQEEFKLEYRRPLNKFKKVTENILFYGGHSSGSRLLVQVTRRPNGLCSSWLNLKLDTGENYVLPQEKFYVEPKTGSESFVGGGLRIKCLVPMRRWRVSYNGLLKKQSASGVQESSVHVKFGFMWAVSSYPQDPSSQIHPKTLAQFLSREDDWSQKMNELNGVMDKWIQSGNLIGQVEVQEEGIEEREVFLWGFRKRSEEDYEENKSSTVKEVICYFKSGEFMHYGEVKLPSAKKPIEYGFIINSTALGGPARKATLKTDENGNQIINLTRGPFTRQCIIKSIMEKLTLNNGDHMSSVTDVSLITATLDGDEIGYGVILENKRKEGAKLPLPNIKLPPMVKPRVIELVLPLTNGDCRLSEISGGKGSSLAELTILAKEMPEKIKFSVPKGVVVTTAAYGLHIKENHLMDIIGPLENISREKPSILQESCKLAASGFEKTKLPEAVKESITANLHQAFGSDISSLKVAVRSSASGEDSEELSAAGQMTTYLGVQGLNEIFHAVVKCWSSQFEFVAIQYKRQNGQVLNSPMAVVIQEMVPADVAGVMFTCDPVTGNPKLVSISANYGIGESVVSASAEPDSIIIGRNESGLNGINKVDIGKKNIQIVLSDDGGVKEEALSEEQARKASLSIEQATTLAEIGIQIEESYGLPVDIEWGFYKNQLYLLQARPITTFDRESDMEIGHELDSPLRSEEEWCTTANVGEVMPGAFSPLGSVSMNKTFETVMRWHLDSRSKYNFPSNPYFLRGLSRIQNHTLFNMLDGILRFYHGKSDMVTEAQMVSMLGRILDDEDMFKQACKRNQYYPPNTVIVQLFYIIKDMLLTSRNIRKAKASGWDFEFDFSKCKDAADIHEELWNQFLQVSKNITVHMDATLSSSFFNIFLLSILVSGNKGWGPNVYKDFAYVLSSCYDVESVDVPNAMDNLSLTISKCTNPTTFKEMKTEVRIASNSSFIIRCVYEKSRHGQMEYIYQYLITIAQDALKWLQTTGSDAGIAFKRFLQHHSHRCYKEFDISSKTWGDNPLSLVKILQGMTSTAGKKNKKVPISTYETMLNLTVPLNWIQKMLVMIAIPLCRNAVGWRERSKSLTIKIFDKSRKAYNQLGERLVKEGRLPDADLLFYLTNNEIDLLVETRSPTLIQKAIRRRAIHPALDKLVFPEVFKGYPKPINYNNKVISEGSVKLKGTPASNGIVEGIVRVATSFEEATNLKNGEILIAYSTDIGWSPFFPMLAGVATELGGLVSHGAVVAREYGLPCVVAVPGVTQILKTGDKIILNGNKGTLERIDD